MSDQLNASVREAARAQFGIDFPPDYDEDNTLQKEFVAEVARFVNVGAFIIR